MSGTSLDGIDGVLVDFTPTAEARLRVLAHRRGPLPAALKAELLALNRSSADEIHRGALAANALARSYADVVAALLAAAPVSAGEVVAIGCHGQTVRHRPGEFDGVGYSIQLNAPALLAEWTGIDVVADFRSRDVAAGGQGAPLVPAFHQAAFGDTGRALAVLNLGGIANLTSIDAGGRVVGFDSGPANALLDLWCAESTGASFDAAGTWAATGAMDARLLASMSDEPYFALPAPKSTGRDLFHRSWLDRHLQLADAGRLRAEDIQATLAELTASTCAAAVRRDAAGAAELIVCGGGSRNDDLMARLRRRLAPLPVVDSDERGLPAEQVEAAAFAWLARQFTDRQPASLPTVTGAAGARVLGALYPAR